MGGRWDGRVDSKEIDSNVALALIFSCILNVIPPSPSFAPPSLSFHHIHSFLDRSCNMKIYELHVCKIFSVSKHATNSTNKQDQG